MKNLIILLFFPAFLSSQSYFKGFWERMGTPIALGMSSGYFDGVGDVMLFKHPQSTFKKAGIFFNPAESWKLKYRSWPDDKRAAFPFAKNALVSFTDGWHLSKSLSLSCYQAMPIFYTRPKRKIHALYDFLILKAIHGVGWELANWVHTY